MNNDSLQSCLAPPAPKQRTHTPTEPDSAVLAEYMRLVEEARSRT